MNAPKGHTVVDFSGGAYLVAHLGKDVRISMYEKLKRLQMEEESLLAMLTREVGGDPAAFVGLLIAIRAHDRNAKVSWIDNICAKVVGLQEDYAYLNRLREGMNDDIVYKLSPVELELFGL